MNSPKDQGWSPPQIVRSLRRRVQASLLVRGVQAGSLLGPGWVLARLRWALRAWAEPSVPPPPPESASRTWHTSVFDATVWPLEHWTRISDFGGTDVKGVWEPARFALAYQSVRAYRAGDNEAPERFWRAVEGFLAQNPPLLGVHYKCGQETALRLLAWTFALEHFKEHPTTTPRRLHALREAFRVGAERIRRHYYYAQSQRNNHSLSEGAGLFTAGYTFPDLPQASRWRVLGRRYLEEEAEALILPDGTFAQYSVNYQRVALELLLWSIRVSERHGAALSQSLRDKTKSLGEWLFQLQDPVSGRLPRIGQWDGAKVLPLSDCPATDFRPSVQACFALLSGQRAFPPGPWDEALAWLEIPLSEEAQGVTPGRSDFTGRSGGFFVLRGEQSFAVMRGIHEFRFRPAQSDLLHADIWWKGTNVAQDPGTFSYNGQPPFVGNPLAEAKYHNTVTLSGQGPMRKLSRFLWGSWPRGETLGPSRSKRGQLGVWEGTHDGYAHLEARHRRAVIQVADEHWLVLDRVSSQAPIKSRLHWLLCDAPFQWSPEDGSLTLDLESGRYSVQVRCSAASVDFQLARADENSPRGYACPAYYQAEPALSIAAESTGRQVWWWTLLGPAGVSLSASPSSVEVVHGDWRATITLGKAPGRLVQRVVLEGPRPDSLGPSGGGVR